LALICIKLLLFAQLPKKAIWLGSVEALDKQAAIEKAAQEFKPEVWRLRAIARR
jgi:hypothetical protein